MSATDHITSLPAFSPIARHLQEVIAVESSADLTLIECQKIINTLKKEGHLCLHCCQSLS